MNSKWEENPTKVASTLALFLELASLVPVVLTENLNDAAYSVMTF